MTGEAYRSARQNPGLPQADFEEVYRALGRVTVYWSQLEARMAQMFSQLSGMEAGMARLVMQKSNAEGMEDYLRSVAYRIKDADEKIAFEAWLTLLHKGKEARNGLIHDTWTNGLSNGMSGHPIPVRSKLSVDKRTGELHAKQEAALSADIDAVGDQLFEVAKALPIITDPPLKGF